MRKWKKIVLVNGGGLAGIAISLFLVSPRTPLWLWAAVSVAALAVLNYVFLVWQGAARGDGSKSGAKTTVIIALGVVVLLLDLVLRYLHR